VRSRSAELACIGFMAAITAVAGLPHGSYVFFPELAALSYEVFKNPHGRWGSHPWYLAFSPPIAGVIGIAVCQRLPFGPLATVAIVGLAIAFLLVSRSPIGPSISAGLLPLVFGVQSWLYPLGILFGTGLLAALSVPWGKRVPKGATPAEGPVPPAAAWLSTELLFVAVIAALAVRTGLRFLMYPPLAVIAFEMFRHRARCPWANTGVRAPLACFAAAAMGYLALRLFGPTPWCAALAVAGTLVALQLLRLHMPPALAVSLLPIVIGHPPPMFPFAVALSTGLAALTYLAYERSLAPRGLLARFF
jgi:hypothetical protein